MSIVIYTSKLVLLRNWANNQILKTNFLVSGTHVLYGLFICVIENALYVTQYSEFKYDMIKILYYFETMNLRYFYILRNEKMHKNYKNQ